MLCLTRKPCCRWFDKLNSQFRSASLTPAGGQFILWHTQHITQQLSNKHVKHTGNERRRAWMWSAGFQQCCLTVSFVKGKTFPESTDDGSAKCASCPHLTMTQLQFGCWGPPSCTGPPCWRLQCFLSSNQLPYRAAVTLNPIIDFLKCHFIQRGTVAFSKARNVTNVFFLLLLLLLLLFFGVACGTLSCCATTMLDVYLLALMLCCCFSLSSSSHPPSCADPRIHPSPTAGSITAASSASTVQGKPSLRRIKGRIHRSKSLDSIDLLDSNVSKQTQRHQCIIERIT